MLMEVTYDYILSYLRYTSKGKKKREKRKKSGS